MRIIDADALLKCKGCAYDSEGHLLFAVGTGDIVHAPTIDAIPVKWLRHRLMMAQKNGSAHPEQAIRYVLWLWEQQKDGEQEEHST